jgi:heptosyltransferase-2
MKIAVFCPNPVGDAAMATPAFRALRGGFPQAVMTAVVRPQVSPVLDGTSWFDFLIPFDPRGDEPADRAFHVVKRLRRERFDLAVLLPNSFRIAAMAYLAGIPRRIGYARHGRGLLLTDRLHYPQDRQGRRIPFPVAESYLEIARRLGCPVNSARLELAITGDDEVAALEAFTALGIGGSDRLVCLNTGGAYGPAKDWPAAHFAELARTLVQETGCRVLVLCGPQERAAAESIVAQAGDRRVVSLVGQRLSLGLTKACIRRSSLLITTDSGPRHFAAAFGIPVITLYGPTHIAWTRTDHPLAWDVFHPVTCGPCQRPHCPARHHRCMRELSPGSVAQLALRVLRQAPASSDDADDAKRNKDVEFGRETSRIEIESRPVNASPLGRPACRPGW